MNLEIVGGIVWEASGCRGALKMSLSIYDWAGAAAAEYILGGYLGGQLRSSVSVMATPP
jgi:hypothetical protein